ncbi:MAG: NAD(P)-dependent glycerol-3-phosphate dehydrogenase [Elusimicrobia bacterium]|nr:NAD(P)-dependent glycerol-3-phosphate dehydrogenase [Elusimicrobiota bacterium]
MTKSRNKHKITVLGAGIWGTVMANLLACHGRKVCLWEFFKDVAGKIKSEGTHPDLPDLNLTSRLSVTTDIKAALENSCMCIIAVPSKHVRKIARKIKKYADPSVLFVSLSKGIETSSLKTACEVMEEEIPGLRDRIMILSGPSFAAEVCKGVPTQMILAGKNMNGLLEARRILNLHPLRIEISPDRKGVELGGALKNVYAIGSGIIEGLKNTGKNTEAAFLTQSMLEMHKIITRLGGKPETTRGLSVTGDMILTGTSRKSRNFQFGEKIGRGMKPETARTEIKTAVEGFESVLSMKKLCREIKIKAPIIETLWEILYTNSGPLRILEAMGFNANGAKKSRK